MVIQPRSSAMLSTDDPHGQNLRDRRIRLITEHGRMEWQRRTGYGRRNAAETAIGRCKRLISSKLRARNSLAQKGEVALAAQVLNRMIREAKPVTVPQH